jgi:hypothetical protein
VSEEKYLGKIASLRLGLVEGRDESTFGITFTFNSDNGWAICSGRIIRNAEDIKWLDKILQDAKVREVKDLVSIPVEVTLADGCLTSWRVLTEVR